MLLVALLLALLDCCLGISHDAIARALLGAEYSEPFARFRPPADMQPASWYASVFARSHHDLATEMIRAAGPNGYVVELGSFIGDSATALVRAAQSLGYNTTVVCVDTWLGDLKMWERKGRLLGPQGATGEPRLWEQFMLNVIANKVSRQIVPVRMPAATAMRYLARKIDAGELPSPGAIYLDTAHAYPDTELELAETWPVLPPGGLLVGDDYDQSWAPVQQSVNEFVATQPAGTFDDPAQFASGWYRRSRRLVSLVDEAGGVRRLPLLLQLPSQWVLRKAPVGDAPALAARPRPKALRCCLAGWADPQPLNWSSSNSACARGRKGGACRRESNFYTRCLPEEGRLRQPTCHVGLRNANQIRRECSLKFACRGSHGAR